MVIIMNVSIGWCASSGGEAPLVQEQQEPARTDGSQGQVAAGVIDLTNKLPEDYWY